MAAKMGNLKIGRMVAVMLLILTLIIGVMPKEAYASEVKFADAATIEKYKDSLGDEFSTEYAGRIWTDKSVFADDVELPLRDNKTQKIVSDSDDDFLVSYSALATTKQVSGATKAPVDVVFIIDTSGSMAATMDSKTRIANTIDALNDAIDQVMAMNPYTRVAVTAFASDYQGAITSEVLLDLGRYEKGTRTIGSGYNQQTITNYFSLDSSGSNPWVYVHAKKEGTNSTISHSRVVKGGTHIQRGLYEGMNVLATEKTVTAEIDGTIVKRIPSVILLSDGAPTFSSEAANWWEPATDSKKGDGSTAYYGNGIKALMVGAYMKEAINRNYQVSDSAMETSMYTIGMGITGLTGNDKNLAYMTLDPGTHWSENNSMANSIRDAWASYTTNDGTPKVTTNKNNETHTLTHPTEHDIDTDPNALKNLVKIYFPADNSSAVTSVFQDIIDEIAINAPEVPTEMKSTDALSTGYITYTDPIGEYMEVKDIKGILFDGKYYPASADGTVSGDVETTLYGTQNLNNIKIQKIGTAGVNQQLQIKIPAAMIPLRINTVMLNVNGTVKSHTNNAASPIRVVYSVGLIDDATTIINNNRVADVTKLSENYLKEHFDSSTGLVSFYSNLYTGDHVADHEHTAGNAIVTFEASHTNPFYYMQNDDPIYKDEAGKTQVSASEGLSDNATYYLRSTYYHGNVEETEIFTQTGAEIKKAAVKEIDGYLYRAEGSPRVNRIMNFAGHKDANVTGTAEDFYYPSFVHEEGNDDPYAGKYVVYQGNNGKVSIPASGALEISKSVKVKDGLNPSTDKFNFTVNFNGDESLSGAYEYKIVGTEKIGTIADGGTLTLEDGETARIEGLPPETTYTVVESDYTDVGFTTKVTGDTGTIKAGLTSKAEFENTYGVQSVLYPANSSIIGTKQVVGRIDNQWLDGETFTFEIHGEEGKPLPEKIAATVSKEDADENGVAVFSFGQIEFTEPGTYTYTIMEVDPEPHLPGMTYSQAVYELNITVEDNGEGELTVPDDQVILKQLVDAAGNEVNKVVTETEYVNSYSAEEVSWSPVATKTYTDTTGKNPFADGKFNFILKPNKQTPDAPMPTVDGAPLTEMQTSNVGTQISFHHITFTKAGTYYYDMQEKPGNEKGMIYDDKVYTVKVEVTNNQQEGALELVATYMDGNQPVTDHSAVIFKNTYDPADAEVILKGTKTLSAANDLNPEDTTFDFKVEAGNDVAASVLGAPLTASAEAKNINEEISFAFEKIVFDKPGTYVFNITENQGNAKGIIYDDHVTVATVTVTDDQSGTLKAVVSYDNKTVSKDIDEAKFINTYAVTPVTDNIALTGTKSLTGRPLHVGEFFFDVYDEQSGTTIKVSNAEDVGDGAKDGIAGITFLKDVVYTTPGTYTYIISENDTSPAPGVTYDATQYRYTVDVEDDGKGALRIKDRVLEIKENESWINFENEIAFKNTYKAEVTEVAIPVVKKALSGNRVSDLTAGEFTFAVELVSATSEDGIVVPENMEALNAADGTVTFDKKVKILKGGEYTLKILEKIPEGLTENADGSFTDSTTGITYSGQEISIKLIANDDGKGNLSVSVIEDPSGMTITNAYHTEGMLSGAIKIQKILTGRDWLETDGFTFDVIPNAYTASAIEAGDVVLPTIGSETVTSVSVNKDTPAHTTVYPDITFHKAGTYGFTIVEKCGEIGGITYDANSYEVEIVAVDNGDGTLTVTATDSYGDTSDGKVAFENLYDPESISISGYDHLMINKVFTGRVDDAWLDTDAFTFHLTSGDVITTSAIENGDIEMPEETTLVVKKDNREHPHFGNIVFHKTGEYHFVVTEEESNVDGISYDTTPRVITVAVTDDGLGALTANVTSADSLTFKNMYYTKEVVLDGSQYLSVEKLLTGRDWFTSDAFTFTLSAKEDSVTQAAIDAGNIIMPNDLSLTITKDDKNEQDKYIKAFGDITFKVPGQYLFEVRETKGDSEGITYDEHCTEIIVTVEDDTIGNLVATAPTYSGSMTFENIYRPKEIQIPIGDDVNGTKLLEGRNLTAEDEFTFRISKADGTEEDTPMPAALEVTNVGNQIHFGSITYTKPGTYIYTIKEEEGILPGISYDKGIVTATVKVTYDPATGKLNSTVSYEKTDGNGGEGFTFVNKYVSSPTDPIHISATKTVTPTEGNSYTIEEGDFEFEILPATSNPAADPVVQAIVPVNSDGSVLFGDVAFTQAGTYSYTIHEVMGSGSGIGYDSSVYTLTVVVTDREAEAKLYADVTVTKDGVAVDGGIAGISFENRYEPTETSAIIYGKKVLNSEHKSLAAEDFQFKLTAEEGTPMPVAGGEVAKNTEAGLFQFGLITYTVPGTYHYTVSEVNDGKQGYTYDSREYSVTVTVEDLEGELRATTEGVFDSDGNSLIVFENNYEPEKAYLNIEGTKKLSVPADSPRTLRIGEFAFALLDEKGTTIGTASNDENGRFAFTDVEFAKAGTYNYKIVEKNSDMPGVTDDPTKEFPVKIEVVDDAGVLRGTATFPQGEVVFTNTYAPLDVSIQLSGVKILEGRQLEKGEFTFIMTDENGKEVSTAVNEETGVVTFDPISYTAEGTYQYQIAEVKGNADRVKYDDTVYNVKVTVKDGGDGYLTATIDQKEEAIVFTNVYRTTAPHVSITKTQAVNGGTQTTEKLHVKAGDKVTYYLTIANAEGVGTASNVTVSDQVPAGLDVVEISGNGVNRDGTIVWNLSPLTGGESRIVSFTVKVPAVDVDTRWENMATVAYDDPGDPNDTTPNDPSLTKETPVPVVIEENIEPLLTIKKKASKTEVEPGDEVTYTMTVKNIGDGAATNVVVTDEVPRGLTIIGFSEGGVNQMGVVSWHVGDLQQGESKSVKVSVVVPEVDKDTSWENIAAASYDEPAKPTDPTSSNEPKEPVSSEPVIVKADVEEPTPAVPVVPEEPEDTDVPPTGDQTNLMVWLMGLTAATAGLAGMRVRIKRKDS